MTTPNESPRARSFTGAEARRLLRRARTASLGTLNRDGSGPYVSLVNIATEAGGSPVVLVSGLAWHTRNLETSPLGSVMVAELPTSGDALTGQRVTVMGQFERVDAARHKARYLAHHPAAVDYVDFADFSFWLLRPERIHAVSGFGRIETFLADEVFLSVSWWEDFATGVLSHMAEDHAESASLYANRLLGAGGDNWQIAAVDPDGCQIVDVTTGQSLRLDFPMTAQDPDEVRQAFVTLSERARKM